MSGIQKVLEKESGSPTAVAATLSDEDRTCTRQLVEYWAKNGYVTPKWAQIVSRKYNIPLHELILGDQTETSN